MKARWVQLWIWVLPVAARVGAFGPAAGDCLGEGCALRGPATSWAGTVIWDRGFEVEDSVSEVRLARDGPVIEVRGWGSFGIARTLGRWDGGSGQAVPGMGREGDALQKFAAWAREESVEHLWAGRPEQLAIGGDWVVGWLAFSGRLMGFHGPSGKRWEVFTRTPDTQFMFPALAGCVFASCGTGLAAFDCSGGESFGRVEMGHPIKDLEACERAIFCLLESCRAPKVAVGAGRLKARVVAVTPPRAP